jgi:SAM-dependent methyltransferase
MGHKPSYLWWQQHGHDWWHEYERRKKRHLSYSIQEAMIASYFHGSSPARLLEYGCGFGRHLRYLNKIEGTEIYGVDQSRSMLEGIQMWAGKNWIRSRIAEIDPRGYLPYPDNHFDIVFTVEVLVHTPPEDIAGVLQELIRVARWQILHLETAPGYHLFSDAHDGCWYHDLECVYKELDFKCERLPQGYKMHAPYRVVLDNQRSLFTWPSEFLNILRQAESNLQFTVDELTIENKNIGDMLEEEKSRSENFYKKLDTIRKKIETQRQEIERLTSSIQEADFFEEKLYELLSSEGEDLNA